MPEFKPVTLELEVDRHGLTRIERNAVDRVAKSIGYSGGIDELVDRHGYSSAREIADEACFTSVRDYFVGDGWHQRLADFNLNGITSEKLK